MRQREEMAASVSTRQSSTTVVVSLRLSAAMSQSLGRAGCHIVLLGAAI